LILTALCCVLIVQTGKDYISVRWTGYLLPAFSETFTIQVTVNDGARVWVDGALIIDQYENEVVDGAPAAVFAAPTARPLVAGQLVAVKIEYRENSGPAAFTLGWYSASQVRLSPVSLSVCTAPHRKTRS